MRIIAIAALFFSVCSSAWAVKMDFTKDEKWAGPNWYVTLSSLMATTIDSGPYGSESACKAGMPSQEEQDAMEEEIGFYNDCRYLYGNGTPE